MALEGGYAAALYCVRSRCVVCSGWAGRLRGLLAGGWRAIWLPGDRLCCVLQSLYSMLPVLA
jgi:hypothetical protein